jgi:photosystem II stability/assembly factor-like uncharacterized protein
MKKPLALPGLKAEVAHPATKGLGFLHQLHVTQEAIYAIGGTYHAPTLLCSNDRGRSFVPWKTPKTPGLRGLLVVDDAVWIIGEYGLVAYTRDAGASWTRVPLPDVVGRTCLYCIARDESGRFWISGDDGTLFRSATPSGKTYEVISTRTSGRMLCFWQDRRDGTPWALDTTGAVQRLVKDRFEIVEQRAKPLCRIQRTAAGTLIVVGDGGIVLRSTDDGGTWKKIPSRVKGALTELSLTRFGIIVVGFDGVVLFSHDDGRTFARVETSMTDRLWSIVDVGDAILVGGEAGAVYRIPNRELARVLHAACADRDPAIAALAAAVRDGVEGAEQVLGDALAERGSY